MAKDLDDYERSMGLDVSSYSTGMAVVDDRELVHHEQIVYAMQDPKDDSERARHVLELFDRLVLDLLHWRPDRVYIEKLSVEQNINTVRNISYCEGAAMMACAKVGIPFQRVVPSSFRARVLGKNMAKDLAAETVREKLGKTEMHLPTPRSRVEVPVFTDDEADAWCLAMFHWVRDA